MLIWSMQWFFYYVVKMACMALFRVLLSIEVLILVRV